MFKTLVKEASILATHNTKVVDIIKDVINRLPIYWAANLVVCPKVSGLNALFTFEPAWSAYHSV